MKFDYFKNNKWSDITRDERFFCAELYQIIRDDKIPFLGELAKKGIIESADAPCEVGFEVCFYRDYIFKFGYNHNGKTTHQIKTITKLNDKGEHVFVYPPKRTFDLCLFFKNEILIIEAKAQQGFSKKQLEEFQKDKELIRKLSDKFEKVNIKIVGLHSSKYRPGNNPNYKESSDDAEAKQTLNFFDGALTWKDISDAYGNSHEELINADLSYNK